VSQGESRLSRAIMGALRARGIYCVKIHGGPHTAAGTPDILACVPVLADVPMPHGNTRAMRIGVFVAFETKMPEGGDPTPVQKHQHGKITAAYGQVFVPRSVQDAVAAIESVGWTPPPTGRPNVSAAI
jgi:hypothetical protein